MIGITLPRPSSNRHIPLETQKAAPSSRTATAGRQCHISQFHLNRAGIEDHRQHFLAFDHLGSALGAYGNDGEDEIIPHPSLAVLSRASPYGGYLFGEIFKRSFTRMIQWCIPFLILKVDNAIIKAPNDNFRSGLAVAAYSLTTFSACGPRLPCTMLNSTRWPSSKDL